MIPLANLVVSPNPPQCLYAVVGALPTIINQTDEDRQIDICYPIIAAAFGTNIPQIHQEALRHMPLLVSRTSSDAMESLVFPGLLDLFSGSDDVTVACACVRALAECLSKLPHGVFCESLCPRITAAWNRFDEPADLADAVWCVLQKLNAPPEVAMKQVVPMVSELLASDATEPPTQVALCKYIKDVTAALVAPRKNQSPAAKLKAPPLEAKRWQTKQPDDLAATREPEPPTDGKRWQAKPAAQTKRWQPKPAKDANPPAEAKRWQPKPTTAEAPLPIDAEEPPEDVPVLGMSPGLVTRTRTEGASKSSSASLFSGMKMGGKSNQ
jgi:hypothetical protein